MKKNVFTAVIGIVLLILSFAFNFDSAVFGGKAHAVGFITSVLVCAYLIVIPFIYKGDKRFLKASLSFSGVIFLASVLGLFAANDMLNIDLIIVPFVVALTPFCGLIFLTRIWNIFYFIMIAVSIAGVAESAFVLNEILPNP